MEHYPLALTDAGPRIWPANQQLTVCVPTFWPKGGCWTHDILHHAFREASKAVLGFSFWLRHQTPHRGLCPLHPRWGRCPQIPVPGGQAPQTPLWRPPFRKFLDPPLDGKNLRQ